MQKKIKILVIVTLFFLIIIVCFYKFTRDKEIGDEGIKLIYKEVESSIGTFDEDSLINLVHIIKNGADYKIFCKFGPAYESANLTELFPNQLVSIGQIKNCTTDTAKEIDEAARSSGWDCRIPLYNSPIPSTLTDYYLIVFNTGEAVEITEEIVNEIKQQHEDQYKCLDNLKELIGEKLLLRGAVGIIDLDNRTIIW